MRLAGVWLRRSIWRGLSSMSKAADEVGDALVGEAALAEDFDFAGEEGGDLGAGVAFGVGAGGFAEFAGGEGDLVDGVGLRVADMVNLLRAIVARRMTRARGWSAPTDIRGGLIGAKRRFHSLFLSGTDGGVAERGAVPIRESGLATGRCLFSPKESDLLQRSYDSGPEVQIAAWRDSRMTEDREVAGADGPGRAEISKRREAPGMSDGAAQAGRGRVDRNTRWPPYVQFLMVVAVTALFLLLAVSMQRHHFFEWRVL